MEKVFVKHVEKLDYSVVEDLIRQTIGDRKYGKVIIKPNLCFHERIPGVGDVDIECGGTSIRELAREFKRPQLDPITAGKMWVWKHKIPNSVLFASRLYPVTRFFGLKIRKLTRRILGMEKID